MARDDLTHRIGMVYNSRCPFPVLDDCSSGISKVEIVCCAAFSIPEIGRVFACSTMTECMAESMVRMNSA